MDRFDQRVRSLRKRLALDFQPLRSTLARGLDVLVDPEAAVLCTATVEALCDALFNVVVKNLHDDAASSVAPLDTKVTIYHIQVALRGHDDLAQVLSHVESASVVLECFMDDATSKALYQRNLIGTRQAKHLRAADENEEELLRLHERMRSEWQRREDDPFTDVDFATVLKCVHPAFTLAYNATMLLSALVRELLNEMCDRANIDAVQRRVPPELYPEDLYAPLTDVFFSVGETGKLMEKTASECLERFRLQSRHSKTLSLRFRVYLGANGNAVQALRSSPFHTLGNVARDAPFSQLLPQMCKKCHLDAPSTVVGIYRGHQLEPSTTPGMLSMPMGAVIFLVSKKWWDHTRRNEARRGLMSSLRPQDALVKSLVESSESRVKKEFQAAPVEATPFGFLGATASSASVLREKPLGQSHSLSRLEKKSSPARPRQRDEEEDNGNEDDSDDDEDSLSALVAGVGRRTESISVDARGLVQTLTTRSTQLLATLDEAWLGFAGLSGGLRTLQDALSRLPDDGDALEQELRTRLAQTTAL
ncbi:TPA: hypothetical protein N0F65_011983, partial [Lagenidium giganteum]